MNEGPRESRSTEMKPVDIRQDERAMSLKQLRAFRDRLPPDFKFDRDEANAR
ncbi:hypothetical protein JQ621_00160 [Bradyrhizobium manausense]|uniref:hypothetical protein n=1 Tax=Bradyrhizobium manausense TaxID=989370 RepID=UPI001BA65EDF|nr:hypothetical protein [Bradyrhizobium manausense]MBR1085886.1 hypothetical protein [Bradyrhizobium manausense]